MKQSDIFSIIFVACAGTLVAFFVCQAIMGKPEEEVVEYRALRDVISNTVVAPEPEIFNSTAINPTIEVYVGDCEDIDQNGILDDVELEECGRIQKAEEDETEEGGEGAEGTEEGNNPDGE